MSAVESHPVELVNLHEPVSFIRRFMTKRAAKSSLIFGVIIGLYMISKASSYLKTYSTTASREKIAETLGNNIGIEALLGKAHHIETVSGYMAWNFLCLITAVGAIWAFMTATKYFRGEEDSGRYELLIAGQTTERRAAINTLIGLYTGILLLFICLALATLVIQKLPDVQYRSQTGLFFALSLSLGAALFVSVGALASQLMPIRSKAIGLCAAFFGCCYMLRLIADTSNANWLLLVSPLGWIERLAPMYGSQPKWLIPIFCLIFIFISLTIYFAGRRDLGEAVFIDKGYAKARFWFLNSPIYVSIRLSWLSILSWFIAIVAEAYVFGQLATGAIVNALSQSASVNKAFDRLGQVANARTVSTTDFLGVTFILIMLLGTFFAASSVSKIREDEAKGYLDNFLVRPYSRLRWIIGRSLLVISILFTLGIMSSLAVWLGIMNQPNGVTLHTVVFSGINAFIPLLFIFGLGILAFGIFPRLTSTVSYGAIAWSFLVIMLSSGLNLNHWLLDTSILHQIQLAPAATPNWNTNWIIIAISIMLCLAGWYGFNRRDIQFE